MDTDNVYGSGLNSSDWAALHKAIWPFIHAKEPSKVEMPQNLPKHLCDHPLVRLLGKYRETGDDNYLDQAGRLLSPTNKPFGWYVVLTKS